MTNTTSRLARWSARIAGGSLLVASLLMGADLVALRDPGAACEQALSTTAVEAVEGWSFTCADILLQDASGKVISNERWWGSTNFDERSITIQQGEEAGYSPYGTLQHEVAHAWAHDNLTQEQQEAFSQRLSVKEGFYGGEYAYRPAEVWARSWASCFTGEVENSTLLVPCAEMIDRWGAPVPRRWVDTQEAAPLPTSWEERGWYGTITE